MIDSHSHIYDKEFFEASEAEEILKKCFQNGTKKIVLIGTNARDSFEARDYAKKWNKKRVEEKLKIPELFWTYGIHPEFCEEEYIEPDFSGDLPVAIGEVGLDYHYGNENKEKQKELLKNMLNLAVKYNLPLSFHVREAFDDFFEIADEYDTEFLNAHSYTLNDDPTERGQCRLRAVIHSFSDSKKNLKKCLNRGFYIGVNGLATYSTLPTPPLERTLLETDAPFLIPMPFHEHHKPGDGSPVYGLHRNDSSYIKYVADFLAKKHETSPENVAKITTENVEKLFGI